MPAKPRGQKLPSFIRNSLQSLRPPERISVSEWAAKYRYLDSKTSAIPGRWSNDVTPYLVEIMDQLNNPEVEEIIFVKPTQVGGSEALLNMIGYIASHNPMSIVVLYPNDTLAKSIVKNRMRPMFDLSPVLRDKLNRRMSNNMELQCDGMAIYMAGARSAASVSSKAAGFLFFDEVDKYPDNLRNEASPLSLARERAKTFTNRKIYITSTPTLRSGQIWQAMEQADLVKQYFVPCPHCGKMIKLEWPHFTIPKDKDMTLADRAECSVYACQECGGIITDSHKPSMLAAGQWREVERRAEKATKVAYWINTLYSPFVRFAEMAREWLIAQEWPEMLQNFINSWLAEPWEDVRNRVDADQVLDRQTNVPAGVVPDWAMLLTGGVDVQRDSLFWTIRAWGPYLTSQNIAHGQVKTWPEIEEIMNAEYRMADKTPMIVNLCAVDSGDQTDEVYEFCSRNAEWAIPIKGAATSHHYYRETVINKPGNSANGTRLVLVDGDKYKDIIASRLRHEMGTGCWMVHADIDIDYANQVTAEQKVMIKRGNRIVETWRPRTANAANHYLDTEVYAFAAADLMEVRSLHLDLEEEPK